MKLIPPSRCTSKLPNDLEKEYLVGEEKLDGSRYVLYIQCDPYERRSNNALLSRRVSVVDGKHVDRTENIPHITAEVYHGLEGTILDGEIMSVDFGNTNSILNSNPKLAVEKQKEVGNLVYHVFDVMFFRGKDVRGLALSQRRKVLEEVVKRMNNEHVRAIPQFTANLYEKFTEIVNNGGEGIIVKDLRMGYGTGWCKLKKSYDVSCIVTGWKAGNGKYKDQIGSLALSVYNDGALVEVGFASGFDDALRKEMSENFENFRGRVVDVFAQESSKPSGEHPCGRLRHPTFHRFRDDCTTSEVTFEKLKKDLKKKVKSERKKFVD